jgi:branched-chain amino acid transport system substrate-binding protein
MLSRFLSLACLGLGFALSYPARAAEPYTIDVVLGQTGGGAFGAAGELQSLQIIEKLANEGGGIAGRPLQFNYNDDQSNPQFTVQLAGQILAKHPAVVLGPSLVATCKAMAPLMANGPVAYCFAPGIYPPPGSYVYSADTSTRDHAIAILRYFRARGWTRIALITSTDSSGLDAERDFDAVVQLPENRDMRFVEREHFNPTDVSAAAQIARIKGAEPQALLTWTTGTPIGTVFKAIMQTGLDIPVCASTGNMTYKQMTQYADFLPKELYFLSSLWPMHQQGIADDPAVDAAQRQFFDAYKAAGIVPDTSHTVAWDPALIVIAALRKLGPAASATALRDEIDRMRYAGITGRYDFAKVPQRGAGEEDEVVVRWSPAEKLWKIVSQPGGLPLATARN